MEYDSKPANDAQARPAAIVNSNARPLQTRQGGLRRSSQNVEENDKVTVKGIEPMSLQERLEANKANAGDQFRLAADDEDIGDNYD